jgi:AcrR family transcriptional regulator
MTIEEVAAKAGVGKATIYRRWPSKGALALDVLIEFLELGPAPDTGTTKGDLVAIVRGVNTGLAHPTAAAVIPGLATDLAGDPELARAFRDRFVLPRRQSVAKAIERAVHRGDLPAEADVELLIDVLSSPFFYRIFVTGSRIEPDLAEKLVDFVLLRQIPKKLARRRFAEPQSRARARTHDRAHDIRPDLATRGRGNPNPPQPPRPLR